ncbi:MAG: hypothetical protein GXY86_08715 [Firmicutes bacterium]|nr:hypothetical protein [Bacillota bacterium]
MVKYKFNELGLKGKMRSVDDGEEAGSGMYLSLLAVEPGEAEAAMVLNSLVDDPDELIRETFQQYEDLQSYQD